MALEPRHQRGLGQPPRPARRPGGPRAARAPAPSAASRARGAPRRPGRQLADAAPIRPGPRADLLRPEQDRRARSRGRATRRPFGTSAGARLTVIRRGGWWNPALRRAPRTRSRASDSAASGRPTIVNPGNPGRDVHLDADDAAGDPVEGRGEQRCEHGRHGSRRHSPRAYRPIGRRPRRGVNAPRPVPAARPPRPRRACRPPARSRAPSARARSPPCVHERRTRC